MIYIVCKSCRYTLRVSGDPAEIEHLFGSNNAWYPDKFPCVRCGGFSSNESFIYPDALKTLDVIDLTPQEAFAALNGLGIPEEQECGPLAIQKVFDESRVKKAHTKLISGTNRSVLEFLEFDNGTRMYFGVSPMGATIYRITYRHSYTKEILNEQA